MSPNPRQYVQRAIIDDLTKFGIERAKEMKMWKHLDTDCYDYKNLCFEFLISVIGKKGKERLDPFGLFFLMNSRFQKIFREISEKLIFISQDQEHGNREA